jgi:transposase-like protein
MVMRRPTWLTNAFSKKACHRDSKKLAIVTCYVVRIFPNAASCLRLIRALAVEMHENWLEAHRYLNMDDLREHKKEALRIAAFAIGKRHLKVEDDRLSAVG